MEAEQRRLPERYYIRWSSVSSVTQVLSRVATRRDSVAIARCKLIDQHTPRVGLYIL
jgi:hypothetical protein